MSNMSKSEDGSEHKDSNFEQISTFPLIYQYVKFELVNPHEFEFRWNILRLQIDINIIAVVFCI